MLDRVYKIFTAGYALWTPDALAAKAEELNAWVTDVRLHPYSKKPGFNLDDLVISMPAYYWLWTYGNVNHGRGGPIQLKQPLAAAHMLRIGLTTGRPSAILLCGCKDHKTCHRTTAAEHYRDWYHHNHSTGTVEIEHLYPTHHKEPTA